MIGFVGSASPGRFEIINLAPGDRPPGQQPLWAGGGNYTRALRVGQGETAPRSNLDLGLKLTNLTDLLGCLRELRPAMVCRCARHPFPLVVVQASCPPVCCLCWHGHVYVGFGWDIRGTSWKPRNGAALLCTGLCTGLCTVLCADKRGVHPPLPPFPPSCVAALPGVFCSDIEVHGLHAA